MSRIRTAHLVLLVHALSALLAVGPCLAAATTQCAGQRVRLSKSCCCGAAATELRCTNCCCKTGTPVPEPANSPPETRDKGIDAIALAPAQFIAAVSGDDSGWTGAHACSAAIQRFATLLQQGMRLNV